MLKYLKFMCAIAYQLLERVIGAIAYQLLERGYYALLGCIVPKNSSTLRGFWGIHLVFNRCRRNFRIFYDCKAKSSAEHQSLILFLFTAKSKMPKRDAL